MIDGESFRSLHSNTACNHRTLSFALYFIPFTFLVSFLSSLTAYIFALSSTNSIIIAPLFSFFIRPGTFLFARGIHVVCRIIACVESSDIAFHILVNIVAFYMLNETVRVGVHDLTFIAIHRYIDDIYTRDEIRTSRLSICRVCTYPRKSAC